ncbi:MAG: phage holin family protein [Gammaproteobacteria bacterium]
MSETPELVMQANLQAVLAQFSLHLQLLQVEWEQEKSRLQKMLVLLCIGFTLFLCTLLSLAALVLVLSWDTSFRVLSIAMLLGFFAISTALVAYYLQKMSTQKQKAFDDSRKEFAADFALLKQWLQP